MTTRTPMKIPANMSATARLTRRKFIGVRMLLLVNTTIITKVFPSTFVRIKTMNAVAGPMYVVKDIVHLAYIKRTVITT